MFFNLLTLNVPDVTPGCFSIFWLWTYLMLLQDDFQSFDFERTWRPGVTSGTLKFNRFKNILEKRQVRSNSTDSKTSWSNVRYAQSQKIENHPVVTSGTFKVKRLQLIDFERTWRYSRMFFNLLTLSVPDVTPGCFSIFWLWTYLMLLQDVFQSVDFEFKRLKNILE
jgi:hypothetical protein